MKSACEYLPVVKAVMAMTESDSWMGGSDFSSDGLDMCSCNFATVRLGHFPLS
jgi:hypothetical protein